MDVPPQYALLISNIERLQGYCALERSMNIGLMQLFFVASRVLDLWEPCRLQPSH